MELKGNFLKAGFELYGAFLHPQAVASVPAEYVEICQLVTKKIGWRTKFKGHKNSFEIAEIKPSKKVLIALSGGLDSVYYMHKLRDAGYEVHAVHVAGLNKQSAKVETERAGMIAKDAGIEFNLVNFNAPKQTYPDNPFKNQLILSFMLEIGLKKGVYRYALGSDWTTPLTEAVTGFTITDSIEVNRSFWQGVQSHFPQAELMFIDDHEKKMQRLEYLYIEHRQALEYVSSCISPLRFREHLHDENQKRYGIRLMSGRCGSCYKCSMEYILLAEMGLIRADKAYYEHCFDVLATSKTAHRPDLFAKSLPLEQRLKNLKNYGS